MNIKQIVKKSQNAVFFFSVKDGVVKLIDENREDGLLEFLVYDTLTSVFFNKKGFRVAKGTVSAPASDEDKRMTLFPSRYMYSWRKLLWNCNDILESVFPGQKEKRFVLFHGWADNYYMRFIGIELVPGASMIDMKLSSFWTDEYRRISKDNAEEILKLVSSGFSQMEMDMLGHCLKKYRDILKSLFWQKWYNKNVSNVSDAVKALKKLTEKDVVSDNIKKNFPIKGELHAFDVYKGNEYLLGTTKSSDDGKE